MEAEHRCVTPAPWRARLGLGGRLCKKIPRLALLLLGFQLALPLTTWGKPETWTLYDWSFPLRVGTTGISLILLAALTNWCTPNRAGVRSMLPITLLMLYVLLAFYHEQTSTPLDISLVWDHSSELLATGALGVISDRLARWQWHVSAALYAAVVVMESRWRFLARDVRHKSSAGCAIIYALAYTGLIWLPFASFDEVALFLRGARRTNASFVPRAERPYPYLNCKHGRDSSASREAPNVFLIMVESFNARFVETCSPEGKEYTPFFNSLIPRGLYATHFYGNAVYTVEGQAATLCSILPALRGCLARDYRALRLRALPQLLREAGYQTVFAQAASDLAFHNTGLFMRALGFETIVAMHPRTLTAEERDHVWGWGLQDDQFYKCVFRLLDERRESSLQPFFVTLATISSHSPFDNLPVAQRALYPQPQHRQEHYANTIRAVDGYLRQFFAQLAARGYLSNSIVIILGDHGHPMGEHGRFATESGCYEENFRVPFLLLWEGQVEPQRLTSHAYSQVDVAPTILDLLGVSAWNHFMGNSMMQAPQNDQAAYLVQPYGGGFISAVRYPYKFVLDLARYEERFFNLLDDPAEAHNLRAPTWRADLRQAVSRVLLNQRLLETNEIWPSAAGLDQVLESVPNTQ